MQNLKVYQKNSMNKAIETKDNTIVNRTKDRMKSPYYMSLTKPFHLLLFSVRSIKMVRIPCGTIYSWTHQYHRQWNEVLRGNKAVAGAS
jgi:hypothetical protein